MLVISLLLIIYVGCQWRANTKFEGLINPYAVSFSLDDQHFFIGQQDILQSFRSEDMISDDYITLSTTPVTMAINVVFNSSGSFYVVGNSATVFMSDFPVMGYNNVFWE